MQIVKKKMDQVNLRKSNDQIPKVQNQDQANIKMEKRDKWIQKGNEQIEKMKNRDQADGEESRINPKAEEMKQFQRLRARNKQIKY